MKRAVSIAAIAAAAVIAATACGGGSGGSTIVQPIPTPPHTDTVPTFAGFDIANYPGDAAMRAWARPSSPYYWTGYYLPAPCHTNTTWAGKFATLTSMGWGVAAVYVGQQDWANLKNVIGARAQQSQSTTQALVTCSASLLSSAQGTSEGADAIARMRADGFPDHSVIFLDVENVSTVTPALADYVRAWITALLDDGHYRPGVYAAKGNAPTLYDLAIPLYHGARDNPPFWIAGGSGFSLTSAPADAGFTFATIWQGVFEANQAWNGVTLTIDVDVASTKSPSTP